MAGPRRSLGGLSLGALVVAGVGIAVSRALQRPVAVFLGALGALLVVSGLAVIAGRQLQRFVKLHVLHYIGATVCLALAAFTAYDLLR